VKIALIGNGAMGKLVTAEARKAGDEIGVIITSTDARLSLDDAVQKLAGHDVAVDFSVGEAVPRNIEACVHARVPLIEGTTGWAKHETESKSIVLRQGGALVYGANFSIGVNVFYRIVKDAASLFSGLKSYAPFIEESHHSRKRDAPSGTALKLQALMEEELKLDVPTSSTRAGYIPGTHRVGFDSEADQILLTHTARSRQGFAAGALMAAHWIVGKSGVYEFSEVIDVLMSDKL